MNHIAKCGMKVIVLSGGILFSLSSQALTYDNVLVGNANNMNDVTGFGAVNHIYRMGKYEVTIGQYTEFLNAVAATDSYGLYHSAMAAITNVAGISRSGSPGSYTYAVINNSGSSANRPISSVSWFDAARFANWMANGQPTGDEDETTTEDGAYELNGAINGDTVVKHDLNPHTNAAPTYYIPTENEWYKAAYYDGAGGYYLYATQSSTLPGNAIDSSDTNQANYLSEVTGYCVTQSPDFSITQNYLTDVGTFSNSPSHYGTFDQTGDVWEWNDLDETISTVRGLRGGAYTSTPPYLQSTYRMGYVASQYNANGGFRLASPA